MFTGIVEEIGTIIVRESGPDSAVVTVRAPLSSSDASLGSSLAVNGVCLTVTAIDGADLSMDVMRETLDRTGLGQLGVGDHVNLERPVRVDGRLDGHIVQGHVDGIATLTSLDPEQLGSDDRWQNLRFAVPASLAKYIAEKGSIALDGVSLTVTTVGPLDFGVSLIPTTLRHTTLGSLEVGGVVNVEVDVVAKYVERLSNAGQGAQALVDGGAL